MRVPCSRGLFNGLLGPQAPMFTVIAFDVSDDKRRYRVVKALRKYAVRVQKSVFEAPELTPQGFQRLRQRLEELIDLSGDKVHYYFLCGGCVTRVETSGRAKVTRREEWRVV